MNDTGKKEKNWVLKDWTVYPQLNLVHNHQSEFYLKPRLMRLFEYLLIHQNEVVTRDAILEYVWEDRIVTENLLTKSISELRKILEEKFGDELEIETIRNVGYRFNIQFVIATGDGKNTSEEKTQKQKNIWPWLLMAAACFGLAGLFFNGEKEEKVKINVELISSKKGQEVSPVISPNGKHIAFCWREETSDPFHIYIRSLEENNPRKLTTYDATEFNPAWSPDGQYLAFMRNEENGDVKLIKKSIIGNDEIELTNLKDLTMQRGMLWSKKKQALIFSAKTKKDFPFQIMAFDLKKDELNILTTPPSSLYGDIHPALTSNEDELYFIRAGKGNSILSNNAPTNGHIFSYNFLDNKTQKIVDVGAEIIDLIYLPKKNQHLFWIPRELGRNELWTLNSKNEKLLTGTMSRGLPGKGSTGKDDLLFYERWNSVVNVDQYDLTTPNQLDSNSSEYLNSTQWDWSLEFSADFEKMAFLSYRNGYQEIWTGSVNSPDDAHAVTALKNKFLIKSLAVSPNGDEILFHAIEDNHSDIFWVQKNGEGLKKLFDDDNQYAAPTWSSDGSYFYYSSNKNGDWEIFKYEMEGTETDNVSMFNGYQVKLNPEKSESIYFTKMNADTIWQYSLSNEKIEFVCESKGLENPNWAPTQNGIYYLAWEGSACQLKYFDFNENKTHNLKLLKNTMPGLASLSALNGKLYIAQSDRIDSDIYSLEVRE